MSAKLESEPPLEAGLVLVDTSVWITFFRSAESSTTRLLDQLLAIGPVAICAPIRAEVISGAPTRSDFQRLRTFFSSLTDLPLPPNLWNDLEESRFALAREGYQASLIDLMIAHTAQWHQVPLWSLDQDFHRIAAVVPLRWYPPR